MDNFCFSSNPKHPKRPVVLVWLRSDEENIPIKTSRVLFHTFLIYNAEKKIVRVSMGNHHWKTFRCPFFIKIRKILMPSKSSNKFTLIDELSSQFPKVYTVTLKLLNIIVFGDSCLPRQVNLWLGVESNHWHTAFTQMLYLC